MSTSLQIEPEFLCPQAHCRRRRLDSSAGSPSLPQVDDTCAVGRADAARSGDGKAHREWPGTSSRGNHGDPRRAAEARHPCPCHPIGTVLRRAGLGLLPTLSTGIRRQYRWDAGELPSDDLADPVTAQLDVAVADKLATPAGPRRVVPDTPPATDSPRQWPLGCSLRGMGHGVPLRPWNVTCLGNENVPECHFG
jgi:hypothetical protein